MEWFSRFDKHYGIMREKHTAGERHAGSLSWRFRFHVIAFADVSSPTSMSWGGDRGRARWSSQSLHGANSWRNHNWSAEDELCV